MIELRCNSSSFHFDEHFGRHGRALVYFPQEEISTASSFLLNEKEEHPPTACVEGFWRPHLASKTSEISTDHTVTFAQEVEFVLLFSGAHQRFSAACFTGRKKEVMPMLVETYCLALITGYTLN